MEKMDKEDIEFKKKITQDRRNAKVSECIWGENEDNSCQGKIVKAHSLQRSKILNKISDNGIIKTLEIILLNKVPEVIFDDVGIKKFSTFSGFCQKHDKDIFQPIEDYNFNNTLSHKYIYAYRSASKEYHTKKESIHISDNLISELKLNKENQDVIFQQEYKMMQDGMSVIELGDICKYMQGNMTKAELHGLTHYSYILKKEYPMACSSCFIPYYDFNGKSLFSDTEKNIMSLNCEEDVRNTKYLFVNIFPENGKTNILISHFKNMRKKYKFLSKLEKLNEEQLTLSISNMIINYIENIAFSPKYIKNEFSKEEINLIKKCFIHNIYDTNSFENTKIQLFK
ncbi:hypothetical protein [Malaciobacter marinus]|uniref:hypothetical protein n=1 Tax=Malaciobacter marinus TaxID=505249 RepID=UPI003B004236